LLTDCTLSACTAAVTLHFYLHTFISALFLGFTALFSGCIHNFTFACVVQVKVSYS